MNYEKTANEINEQIEEITNNNKILSELKEKYESLNNKEKWERYENQDEKFIEINHVNKLKQDINNLLFQYVRDDMTIKEFSDLSCGIFELITKLL